jgi:hypothetical protein
MNLLECLIAIALSLLLLNPLLKSSADLVTKQIQYEKTQALASEADRAFTLIGRAIRMAGYQNKHSSSGPLIEIQNKSGYRGSDSLIIRHELSGGIDFDCIGNTLTKERTKNHFAYQGFLVDRQASLPKGIKANGGSLICQSLDRQGRLQNTTLMNGVNLLLVEEIRSTGSSNNAKQKRFKVKLQMTDGALLNLDLERTFSTRNLL